MYAFDLSNICCHKFSEETTVWTKGPFPLRSHSLFTSEFPFPRSQRTDEQKTASAERVWTVRSCLIFELGIGRGGNGP